MLNTDKALSAALSRVDLLDPAVFQRSFFQRFAEIIFEVRIVTTGRNSGTGGGNDGYTQLCQGFFFHAFYGHNLVGLDVFNGIDAVYSLQNHIIGFNSKVLASLVCVGDGDRKAVASAFDDRRYRTAAGGYRIGLTAFRQSYRIAGSVGRGTVVYGQVDGPVGIRIERSDSALGRYIDGTLAVLQCDGCFTGNGGCAQACHRECGGDSGILVRILAQDHIQNKGVTGSRPVSFIDAAVGTAEDQLGNISPAGVTVTRQFNLGGERDCFLCDFFRNAFHCDDLVSSDTLDGIDAICSGQNHIIDLDRKVFTGFIAISDGDGKAVAAALNNGGHRTFCSCYRITGSLRRQRHGIRNRLRLCCADRDQIGLCTAGNGDLRAVRNGHINTPAVLCAADCDGDLIFLILCNRGNIHAANIAFYGQCVVQGLLIKRRRQLTFADSQAAQVTHIGTPFAADVRTHILGVHDTDHITGHQGAVRDLPVCEAQVYEPVVERSLPTGTGTAVKLSQSHGTIFFDGADIGGIPITGVIVPAMAGIVQSRQDGGHHGHIVRQVDFGIHQSAIPGGPFIGSICGIFHDHPDLALAGCKGIDR